MPFVVLAIFLWVIVPAARGGGVPGYEPPKKKLAWPDHYKWYDKVIHSILFDN